MLKYIHGGLGVLFFFLIISTSAQAFLQELGRASPAVMWALVSVPLLAILIGMVYDVLSIRSNALRYRRNQPLMTTMGGIGVLFFFLLLTKNGQTIILSVKTFSSSLQVALLAVPILAMIAALIVTLVNVQTMAKEKI